MDCNMYMYLGPRWRLAVVLVNIYYVRTICIIQVLYGLCCITLRLVALELDLDFFFTGIIILIYRRRRTASVINRVPEVKFF